MKNVFWKSEEVKVYEEFVNKYIYLFDSVTKEDLYKYMNDMYMKRKSIVDNGVLALTPLNIEIAMGNIEEVLRLINEGEDVNEVNSVGLTPLGEAILLNNYELINILIEKGASVKGNNKYSPLLMAASKSDDIMMYILLKNNANVNQVDEKGFNALHYLFDDGSLSCCQKYDNGVLDFATVLPSFNMIESINKIKCINVLNEYGIDLNYGVEVKNYSGKTLYITPLALALKNGNSKIVKSLIDLGSKKEAIELRTTMYDCQDEINSADLSLVSSVSSDYIKYLKYIYRVRKNNVKIYNENNDKRYMQKVACKKLEKKK